MATVRWRGTEIAAKVQTAARIGLDQTTAAAATHAKQNHEWNNVTGTLEGSLQARPAETVNFTTLLALWGSFDVEYAIWLEIGTAVMAERPYLRPAADAEYPKLLERIRAALLVA